MEIELDNSKAAMSKRLNEVFLYIRKNTEYVNQTLFAQKIGEPRSNFSAALNGNEKYMTEGVVKKVVAAFPEIDKEWLLSGKGSMLVENDGYENDGQFLRTEREKYGLTLTDIYEHTHIPIKKLKAYEMWEEEMPPRTRALLELYFDQVAFEYDSQEDEDLDIPILKTELVDGLPLSFSARQNPPLSSVHPILTELILPATSSGILSPTVSEVALSLG